MPNLTGTVATGYRTVRVTFDAVLADRTTGPNGARNPANWTLTGQPPGPAAAVAVDHVDEASTSSVDLQLAAEPSFGQGYLVVAKPIADGGITGVVAPANQGLCVALAAPVVDGRGFSIAGLIPRKNWREDDSGDLAKFVACLEDVFSVLLLNVDEWVDILDSDRAPAAYLDLMLRDLGFRFEGFTLTTARKRRILRALVGAYKLKGTATGLLAALRLIAGETGLLVEANLGGMRLGQALLGLDWVLGGDVRYAFGLKVLRVGGGELTADEEVAINTIVAAWRPAHTHLSYLQAALPAPTSVAAAPAVGGVDVSWASVPNATGYVIYSRTTAGVTPLNGQRITGVTSPHTIVVPAGQTLHVIVVALNTAGNEGFTSAEASATAS